MSYLYDVEDLTDDIKALMVANLNTKIAAINAEKADSIVLKTIDDAAYIFQSLDERVMNYDPFVFYGLGASVESEGIGPAGSKMLPIDVAIISFDLNNPDIGKRALRYNRALEEIFLDKWADFSGNNAKIKVKAPVLIDFTLLNTSDPFRVIGVELEAHLA